tara:strand:- start:849 stop:3341 length:2493 start_codon:yes stop_codon:yes gene_type:complete
MVEYPMFLGGFYTSVERLANNLLYRGYDDNGKKVSHRIKYKPTVYLKSDKPNTTWKSLDGVPVEPLQFSTMRELRDFQKTYKDVPDYKIYGNNRHIPAFIQGQFPNEIPYDRRLIDIASIDIETEFGSSGFPEIDNPINAILSIAYKSSKDDTYRVWGLKGYDEEKTQLKHLKIEYRQFTDEQSLLQAFIDYWSAPDNTPDIITGWNTRFFDIPYMISRMVFLLGEECVRNMSPWRKIERKDIRVQGMVRTTFDIMGIQHLDYMELFKKFAYTYGNQESYSLNHISSVVLDEKKLDYSEIGTLRDLYDADYQMFIDYNIKDVELIERMEEKLGLITLVMTMAYLGGVNYQDTLGTTAIWDSIIFRRLARSKIAIPPSEDKTTTAFPGGYVKDPQVGMHDWVMSFDLNSLYPNIIVQYNMSPETLLTMSGAEGATASNGAVFTKAKKGIIPEIVEELYDKRVIVKKEMLEAKTKLETISKRQRNEHIATTAQVARLETLQTAIKILMNSLYGAMGNKYFRYFDLRIASAITLTGQEVIKYAETNVNNYLDEFIGESKDRVIAMDTDSLYIGVKDVIDKFKPGNPVSFLDEFGSKAIEPMLDKAFDKFAKESNAYTNRMVMKREAIADRGVWTAKKRYILNVHNNEGVQYAEPKIKVTGIEAVKSSTPQVCRTAMKEMFKIIVNGDEEKTQEAIKLFKEHFKSLSPDEVAFPRGVTNISKWASASTIYEKGTPIHVRGSLLYNRQIRNKGLEKKYEIIQNGDKIKFIYLMVPNAIQENVIAFPGHLPEDLELHNYINYDLQFEKTFLAPIEIILNAIGWKSEPQADLQDFFF